MLKPTTRRDAELTAGQACAAVLILMAIRIPFLVFIAMAILVAVPTLPAFVVYTLAVLFALTFSGTASR